MSLHRDLNGEEPLRAQPVERPERRRTATSQVATGSLACPACDAPVLPDPAGMAAADPISCGFCDHTGAVRDFLSLGEPTRPARVVVRVRALPPHPLKAR